MYRSLCGRQGKKSHEVQRPREWLVISTCGIGLGFELALFHFSYFKTEDDTNTACSS